MPVDFPSKRSPIGIFAADTDNKVFAMALRFSLENRAKLIILPVRPRRRSRLGVRPRLVLRAHA